MNSIKLRDENLPVFTIFRRLIVAKREGIDAFLTYDATVSTEFRSKAYRLTFTRFPLSGLDSGKPLVLGS